VIALKYLSILLGLLSLYISAVLYEDEEGRIQNRLEEWWIRLADKEKAAVSKHVEVVRKLARLTMLAFDTLFGKKLFSWSGFIMSCLVSLASYNLYVLAKMAINVYVFANTSLIDWGAVAKYGGLSSFFLCFATAPLIVKDEQLLRVWKLFASLTIIVSPAILMLADVTLLDPFDYEPVGGAEQIVYGYFHFLPLILLSLACDFAFLAFTRKVLAWCTQLDRPVAMISTLVLNFCLALLLVWIPANLTSILHREYDGLDFDSFDKVYQWDQAVDSLGDASEDLARFNVIDGCVAGLFFAIALLMLVHRLVWPTAERSVYALQKIGIVGRRKFLAIIGISLLGYGGWALPESARKMLELFIKR
jgi:hypothetical protein